MYLLDIDTIIYNLKGHEAVRKNLERHINDSMCISIIIFLFPLDVFARIFFPLFQYP